MRDTSIGASIYIDEDIPFNNLDNQKEFFFGVGTTAKISPKLRVIVDLSYTSGSRTLLGDEPTNSLNSSYQTKVFKIGLVF